jgi:DNA polymerase-1
MKKKLLLVDASNLLFRSYYATAYTGNLMQTKEGKYTNGVYGFVRAMRTLIDRDFTHIIVALDSIGKTHRHYVYEDYKGTRDDTPQELIEQFDYMERYLKAAGIYAYRKETYEADDVIGYSVKHFKDQFDEIVIYSNDQDLMQLIDDHVYQMVSKKGLSDIDMVGRDGLKEKLGLTPSQVPDYKGLVGDSSDNIPGIKGIGKKTAAKLLSQYPSLEEIINNIPNLKGKLKERLEENQEVARFSKKLATIDCDFDNDIDIEKAEYQGPNLDELKAFYQEMSFRSYLNKLNQGQEVESQSYKFLTKAALDGLTFADGYLVLETFGNNYHDTEKLGFGLMMNDKLYYLNFQTAIQSPVFVQWLKDQTYQKYVYDYKKIKVILLWEGLDIEGVVFDLMLGAYLLNDQINQDDFSSVTQSLDYEGVLSDDLIYGRGAKKHVPKALDYQKHIISKVKAIQMLHHKVLDSIHKNNQDQLFHEIEVPLAKTLAEMEFTGIAVDLDELQSFGQDLDQKIDQLESKITDLAGESFNINSPQQLSDILFDKLGLPPKKKTKSGYSTDVSVLEKLKKLHPIISEIMLYRTYTKLKSTYYEGLLSATQLKDDSKIHTIYLQAQTKTGRLSSREPNLQNLPIRKDIGKSLRKVFVGHQDHLLLSLDYSQIELRVVAEMANVENLKTAFLNDRDIHMETAKKIFGKDDISDRERSIAKAINFSIIYGKTTWGLSEELDITPKEAERFINTYFETYPEIKEFTDKQIAFAKENGYVETMFHRRTLIPEISSRNYQTRQFGQRIAMNAPIQGSAADILKLAMVEIDQRFKQEHIQSKIILQIHDEVVLDVVKDELDQVIKITQDTMENILDIDTKLVVHYSSGPSLFEVK